MLIGLRIDDEELEVNEVVIENRSNEHIEIDQNESDNMRLMNLTNCGIVVKATLKTIYFNNIKNCKIVLFPVENSIFGDGITDSTINCTAQQIRIHHTNNTQFNIFVSSSMIIEDR